MAAVAGDLDLEAVGGRQERPLPDREHAERDSRHVVHAVDLLDLETVHDAVVHHLAPAAAALFGRLEDDNGVSGEIARLREIARRAQQHGRVAVMTAGVHLARRFGFVGDAGRLDDRQRVHVGAQADGAARALAALDHTDDPGAPKSRHHLVAAEFLQLLFHDASGAEDIEHEFGVTVQILPPDRNFIG